VCALVALARALVCAGACNASARARACNAPRLNRPSELPASAAFEKYECACACACTRLCVCAPMRVRLCVRVRARPCVREHG
jgi:hypothetical protein